MSQDLPHPQQSALQRAPSGEARRKGHAPIAIAADHGARCCPAAVLVLSRIPVPMNSNGTPVLNHGGLPPIRLEPRSRHLPATTLNSRVPTLRGQTPLRERCVGCLRGLLSPRGRPTTPIAGEPHARVRRDPEGGRGVCLSSRTSSPRGTCPHFPPVCVRLPSLLNLISALYCKLVPHREANTI